MKKFVVMSGGFHPFHAGHADLYQQAKEAFPDARVLVCATNVQEDRPFPFALKKNLAQLSGVPSKDFIQVSRQFSAQDPALARIIGDQNNAIVIYVRSDKDRNEAPQPWKLGPDGKPPIGKKGKPLSDYLLEYPGEGQPLDPVSKHAYMTYLRTVEFGPGITSASEIRNAWPKLNEKRKLAMVMSLYPATKSNPQLAQNVVGMFDQVMGAELKEEFRPSTSQAMNIQRQTRQKMNPGTNRFVWKRPNQIGGSYTENELKSLNFKYSAKYNMWGGTQQMWDQLTSKVNEFAPPSSGRDDGGGEDSRSRRIRKLLEIAIQVAKEKNVDELGMIHAMNTIAGDEFFNTAVEGILPDITDKEYMFVLQSAYKTVKQGMTEGKRKRKKKSKNRSLGRYFFPGYSYYGGSGESGEGGGDGGGEGVNEFAPPGSNDGVPDEDRVLRQLAATWWCSPNDKEMWQAEKSLVLMGWEIGQDESGDSDAGAFIVRKGDKNGKTYTSFGHTELEEIYNNMHESVNEDYLDEK